MPSPAKKPLRKLAYHPLTIEMWEDFETLFGERGACGGCWCMWWRLTRSQFEKRKGGSNKRAMRRIVAAGHVPGILAYDGDQAVGWCAIEPREQYPSLGRSRVLARLDEKPVWSIAFVWTGMAAAFRKAGFREVLRGSETRPIMRRAVRPVT